VGYFNIGDIVGRKSYNRDIFFKITDFFKNEEGRECAHLKGIFMRLLANAPLDDLEKVEPGELTVHLKEHTVKGSEQMNRILARRRKEREFFLSRAVQTEKNSGGHSHLTDGFDLPGTVLHIDGDSDYLELCLTTYKQLNIPANGYCVNEEQQPQVVGNLLAKHIPDLLVLTGHDGLMKGKVDFSDVNNYYSSKYFVAAVKEARRYEKSMDDLVIFAGACQSHYEAILSAGANFASSPRRVMIHAYDPVFVVEKIAYTSIYDPISIKEIISGTITGFSGIGGVETRGKFRIGIPKSPY